MEEEAFEKLFKSHYRSLFAYGYHLCADRELTKDQIQSLYLELWEKQNDLSEVTHPLAYLKKALHRNILRELQRKRRPSTADSSLAELAEPSYEELLINFQKQAQQQQQLEAALLQLSAGERQMLEARFKKGLNYQEIADQFGKSKQTVYNQIHTAIKKLRKAILFGLLLFF